MYKKKLKMGLLLFLVFSMVLVSPKITKAQNDTIKIGALGPLAITPGVDMRRGSELAVSEINGAGGFVVGSTTYDFDLIVETTSGSDGLPDINQAGTSSDKLLLTDNVVAALGAFRTEVVLGAVQPKFNLSKVPFLGVGSTAPLISEYYYRVGPVNGTTLVRNLIAFYLFEMAAKGVTEVVVVREGATWTAAVAAGLKPTLQVGATLGSANFTFVTDIVIDEAATGPEIATALGTINSSTQAILPLFSAPVGKTVTEQWAATGLSATMYMAGINVEAQKNSHFVDTDGAAAGEILFEVAPPGEFPSAKTEGFISAYQTAYGVTPTYTSYASYDSVFLIKEALMRAGVVTSAGVHAEMPNSDYVGVSGKIKFTSENNWGQIKNLGGAYDEFNNTIVHDLHTPSTVGVSGAPYVQVYFSQWTVDGLRKAVWKAANIASIASPPYVPTTVTNTETVTGGTETVTGSVVTVTDTEDAPAFYLVMALISTIFVATYISRVRKRKGF